MLGGGGNLTVSISGCIFMVRLHDHRFLMLLVDRDLSNQVAVVVIVMFNSYQVH